MSNKSTRKFKPNAAAKSEAGFTLIEVVVAIFVVTIGLIGAVAAITYALEFGSMSRNVTAAKSIIVGTVEEVETLRNARRLEFKQIANVGAVNNTNVANRFTGFTDGFQAVSTEPGADGVNGTDDDFTSRGGDGVFGTPDDVTGDLSLVRAGYDRQISITNLSNSLKKIEIRVQYVGRAGNVGEITGVCYLNDEVRITR